MWRRAQHQPFAPAAAVYVPKPPEAAVPPAPPATSPSSTWLAPTSTVQPPRPLLPMPAPGPSGLAAPPLHASSTGHSAPFNMEVTGNATVEAASGDVRYVEFPGLNQVFAPHDMQGSTAPRLRL